MSIETTEKPLFVKTEHGTKVRLVSLYDGDSKMVKVETEGGYTIPLDVEDIAETPENEDSLRELRERHASRKAVPVPTVTPKPVPVPEAPAPVAPVEIVEPIKIYTADHLKRLATEKSPVEIEAEAMPSKSTQLDLGL